MKPHLHQRVEVLKRKLNIHINGPFLIFRKAKAVSSLTSILHNRSSIVAGLHSDGWRLRVSVYATCLKHRGLPEEGATWLVNRTCFSLSPLHPPSKKTMVQMWIKGGLNQIRLGSAALFERDIKCFCRYLLTVTTGNTTRKKTTDLTLLSLSSLFSFFFKFW
uniref:Uncharacterized protein n=1 Tax=Nothobranchius rachovii TaxID=451742 RepID=A0A1A8P7A3_9TELE